MGKTIAQELFAIAEEQGGTVSGYPRTIAGAVDALTDALAGSDVDSGRTIAQAVNALGDYIGGGSVSLGNMAVLNTVDFSGDEVADCYIGTVKCASLVPGGLSCVAGGVNVEIFDEGISELGTVTAVTKAGYAPSDTPTEEVPFTDFTAEIDEDWECLKITFTMPNVAMSSQGGVGLIRFTYSNK